MECLAGDRLLNLFSEPQNELLRRYVLEGQFDIDSSHLPVVVEDRADDDTNYPERRYCQ